MSWMWWRGSRWEICARGLLYAYIGQPSGSVYGSPDSGVHRHIVCGGRGRTLETIYEEPIAGHVPERSHRQGVEFPVSLLWYATWIRPQAQSAQSISKRAPRPLRPGTGHAMDTLIRASLTRHHDPIPFDLP